MSENKINTRDSDELIRAFVAVPVGEAAAREIERLLTRLAASSERSRLRWVTRMQLHITLKFLGECTQAEIDRARSALAGVKLSLKDNAKNNANNASDAAINMTDFEITLGKVGAFPNMSRPNVLWLGATQGAKELTALAARVEDALAAVGFPRERKPFQPHLTLARAKGERLPDKLVNALNDIPVYSWPCSNEIFCLMRSKLTPRGAIYTPIKL